MADAALRLGRDRQHRRAAGGGRTDRPVPARHRRAARRRLRPACRPADRLNQRHRLDRAGSVRLPWPQSRPHGSPNSLFHTDRDSARAARRHH